jgi:hypothetical protein
MPNDVCDERVPTARWQEFAERITTKKHLQNARTLLDMRCGECDNTRSMLPTMMLPELTQESFMVHVKPVLLRQFQAATELSERLERVTPCVNLLLACMDSGIDMAEALAAVEARRDDRPRSESKLTTGERVLVPTAGTNIAIEQEQQLQGGREGLDEWPPLVAACFFDQPAAVCTLLEDIRRKRQLDHRGVCIPGTNITVLDLACRNGSIDGQLEEAMAKVRELKRGWLVQKERQHQAAARQAERQSVQQSKESERMQQQLRLSREQAEGELRKGMQRWQQRYGQDEDGRSRGQERQRDTWHRGRLKKISSAEEKQRKQQQREHRLQVLIYIIEKRGEIGRGRQ